MWRAYSGVIHSVIYQIPNLQNCFTTPDIKPWGGGGLIQITPAARSLYRSIFKKSRHIGTESISYLVHGKGALGLGMEKLYGK